MRLRASSNLKINTNIENNYYNDKNLNRNNPYSTKELKNTRIGLSPKRNYTALINTEIKNDDKKLTINRSNSRIEYTRSHYNPVLPNSTKANTFNKSIHLKAQPMSTRNTKESFTTDNTSEPINIMSIFSSQNKTPLTLNNLTYSLPGYENSKHSVKQMHLICGYAANTHQGIIR